MKKILIADDSLFMRMILKDIISRMRDECIIVEADSGKSALELFKKENPDLILLDIIMPGSEDEGLKVLGKVIKADPKANVVMITAVGQDMVIEECKRLGAKNYIVKPFDEKQIVETVGKYLG